MNKSLLAFLKGYYKFDVNGKTFYLYNSALEERLFLSANNCKRILFIGKHIFKGKIGFYFSWKL